MKILITGGRGQLGESFGKLAGDYPAHEFYFADLPELDITDAGSVSRIIGEAAPDVIVNCAAFTAVDAAESEPEKAEAVNASAVAILASIAAAEGIKLVQISTDYVFDGQSDRPILESHTPDPLGVYGRTKLQGEEAVRNSGADAVIVRTAWLYSEFGSNFVKTILRVAEQNDEIRVVDDQFGSPTYAPDLARAVMTLVDRGITGCHTFHFSDEGAVSRYELAHAVVRLAGLNTSVVPVPTSEFPTAAKRPAYTALSTVMIQAAGVDVPYWKDSLRLCLKEMGKLK